MNFTVKSNVSYKEFIVRDGSTTMESGLLDEDERRALATDLQEAIDDLLAGLEEPA